VLFIVRFSDRPGTSDQRASLLPAHLAWLAANSDRVLAAGSLRVEPGLAPVGGCWIVRADSNFAVEKLFQTDPFWVAGIRSSYEILHWSPASSERFFE
jgi:uncharacterized protein